MVTLSPGARLVALLVSVTTTTTCLLLFVTGHPSVGAAIGLGLGVFATAGWTTRPWWIKERE